MNTKILPKLKTSLIGLALVAATTMHAQTTAATISSVSTSLGPAQKFNLRVDGKPFYMTSVQVRLDKLRYYWNFGAAEREAVIAQAAADGFNTVSIPIHWYEIEVQKNSFHWAILEEYLGLAAKYNLKVELLWFSQNSGGSVQWLGDTASNPVHLRTPDYVLYSPGPTATTTTSDYTIKTGSSPYTLDLADPNLLAREKYVLGQMMNRIASWDGSNGNKHTVVGIQLGNEVRGRSMQFSPDRIVSYMSALGGVVKSSPYSVWTRLNCVNQDTNSRIDANEALRASGGTNIDFVGIDLYDRDLEKVQRALPHKGLNFRMIMESGAEIDAAARLQVAALGSNNAYDHYDFLGPDGHGMYVRAGATGFRQNGAYVDDVRLVNHLFNGANQDLAMKAQGIGLFVHNIHGDATTATTGVEGIVYTPTVTSDSAVSITRSNTEIVLLNMKGGSFSWPAALGITGAQRGYFDNDNVWVNQGSIAFSSTGMTPPAGTIVRLTKPVTK
jgi:hypothetical protein